MLEMIDGFLKECNNIRYEEFFLLAAEHNNTAEIYEIFKSFKLIQYHKHHNDCFKLIEVCILNNNHYFLSYFLDEYNQRECSNLFNEKLIKEACRHLECFKILFQKDQTQTLQSDDVFKFCLENKLFETFEFLVDSLKDTDKLSEQFQSNLFWHSNEIKSLFHLILKTYFNSDEIQMNTIENVKKIFSKIFKLNKMSLSNEQTVNIFNHLFFPTDNKALLIAILQNGTKMSNALLKFLVERDLELEKEILNATNIEEFEIKLDLDNLIKYKTFYSDDLIEKLFEQGLVEMRINSDSFVRLFARDNLKLCRCLLEKIEISGNLETNHFESSINEIIRNNNEKLAEFFFFYLNSKYNEIDFYSRYFFNASLKQNKDELIGFALTTAKNNMKLLTEMVKKILDSKGMCERILSNNNSNVLINLKLPSNQNILHYAVTNFDFKTFGMLAAKISKEEILKKTDDNEKTPMDIVIQRLEIRRFFFSNAQVKEIVEKYYSFDAKPTLSSSSLYAAIERNDKVLLKKLLNLFNFKINDLGVTKSPLDCILTEHDNKQYDDEFLISVILENEHFKTNLNLSFKSLVAICHRTPELMRTIIENKHFKFKDISENFEQFPPVFTQIGKNEKAILCLEYFYKQNKQSLINKSFETTITKNFDFADYLIENYFLKNNSLLDSLTKEVLFKLKSIDYLKYYVDEKKFEIKINLAEKQTFLHYTAEHCNSEVFNFFLQKNKAMLKCIDQINKTPLDFLIQVKTNRGEFIHSNCLLFEIINENLNNELELSHRSFITLLNRSKETDETACIEKLLASNCKFNRQKEDENEKNASLDDVIQRRNQNYGIFFFSNDFIRKKLLPNLLRKKFFGFKLSHSTFEVLCERDDSELLNKILNENNYSFNHEGKHFNDCFESLIKSSNQTLTKKVLDYLQRDVFSDEPTDLIEYMLKYIEFSVLKFEKPEMASFLISELDKLRIDKLNLIGVKDSLIRSVFEVNKFYQLMELLLSNIDLKNLIKLDEKQNIFHYAAAKCGNDTFQCLFSRLYSESNYMNEKDCQNKTPLDILIQKKQENQEKILDFKNTLLKHLEINNKQDKSLDQLIFQINQRPDEDVSRKASFNESTSSSDQPKNGLYFTSSFIKSLIEENSKKHSELKITYESFLALCNRSDSIQDRNILIEYLIAKVENKEKTAKESAIHFLIIEKCKENNEYFFSTLQLKNLIEKQSADFKFIINFESFKTLCIRGDLNLIRLFIEKADFATDDDGSKALNLIIQEKKNDDFVFTNSFIKQLKDEANIFKFELTFESFSDICKRNDHKLMKRLIINYKIEISPIHVQILVSTENIDLIKCAFENMSNKFHFVIFRSMIESSIKCKKMNIAEYTIHYVKNEYPDSFAEIVEIILSNEEFIVYLLQQKLINH